MRFRALAALAASAMLGALYDVPALGQYLAPSGFTRIPLMPETPANKDSVRERPAVQSHFGAGRWRPPSPSGKTYPTAYPTTTSPAPSNPSEVIDTPSSRRIRQQRAPAAPNRGTSQSDRPATTGGQVIPEPRVAPPSPRPSERAGGSTVIIQPGRTLGSATGECGSCGGYAASSCGDDGNGGTPACCQTYVWDGWGCTAVDGPQWTFTADALLLNRDGTRAVKALGGAFDAPDLGNAAGPRLGLRYQGEEGQWEVEGIYFGIHDWTARSCADVPPDSVMGPCGGTFQFQYASRLDSAEINVRRVTCDGICLLAGFRWIELQERFVATGYSNAGGGEEGFARTNNDLYGFQIGAETCVWDGGSRFHVDAWIKAGIYGNSAEVQTSSSWTKFEPCRSRSVAAFEGEIGLVGVLQVTPRLAVRGGYQVMWLDAVALAPDQIVGLGPAGGDIDTRGSLFFHGAVVGAELKF